MLDEQIDQEKLVVQFRERLISRLDEIGLGKSGLAALFEEMDIRRKGELTITELSNMLFKLNFHASKVSDAALSLRGKLKTSTPLYDETAPILCPR